MMLPENDYQILKLTDDFYNAYPNPPYKEILKKKQRAYNCLLFQTHYNYFICIPFRTEISHSYAFHFTTTTRSKAHRSGLDYSKLVIIAKTEYIDSTDAMIDKDEFNETIINLDRIKREALDFVEEYVVHVKGTKKLHKREFDRRYRFSPLKYFHKELGI
ncbi:MAG: type III toxin-antitoxin system TenpIN family toxin [Lachnospiraceae bacterium]